MNSKMKITMNKIAAISLSFLTGLTGLVALPVAAQSATQMHFNEVHLAQSYTGPDGESVMIRGLTHTGKKVQVRINGVGTLAYGAQAKSDCVKFATLASMDDRVALEVYFLATTPTLGAVDTRGYREATVTVTASQGVSCLIANKSKYDYSTTSIAWFDI